MYGKVLMKRSELFFYLSLIVLLMLVSIVPFAILYRSNIPYTHDFIVFYMTKCTASVNAYEELKSDKRFLFHDISSVPISSPIADTKLQSVFNTNRRVRNITQDGNLWTSILHEEYKFKNETPHFVRIENGKVVDYETGYPNKFHPSAALQ